MKRKSTGTHKDQMLSVTLYVRSFVPSYLVTLHSKPAKYTCTESVEVKEV